MDVPISPALRKRRKARRWFAFGSVAVALALVTLGLSKLHPAMPSVEKGSLYFGTVQRGEMVRQVRGNDTLANEKLVSSLDQQRSRTKADELRERYQIEQDRLKASAQSTDAQLAVQQAEVERARALLARKRQQVAALRVRAGVAGVLRQ